MFASIIFKHLTKIELNIISQRKQSGNLASERLKPSNIHKPGAIREKDYT